MAMTDIYVDGCLLTAKKAFVWRANEIKAF